MAKEVDGDGDHVVRIQTRTRKQRGQEVMLGPAVVALPTRSVAADLSSENALLPHPQPPVRQWALRRSRGEDRWCAEGRHRVRCERAFD